MSGFRAPDNVPAGQPEVNSIAPAAIRHRLPVQLEDGILAVHPRAYLLSRHLPRRRFTKCPGFFGREGGEGGQRDSQTGCRSTSAEGSGWTDTGCPEGRIARKSIWYTIIGDSVTF